MSITAPAKRLIVDLLKGGYLLPWKRPSGTRCFRLYLGHANPIRNVRSSTVGSVYKEGVLKEDKKTGKAVISRSKCRKLRGNHSIKKIYKQMLKGNVVTITQKSTKPKTNAKPTEGKNDGSGQIPLQF